LDNVLTGNSGVNTLNGGAGNDTLDGGAGADILVGGIGDDIYVAESGDTLTENAGEGLDTVRIGTSYTLLANFENLTLTGNAAINGTGNASDNIITGNTAANILTGGLGNDIYVVDNNGDTTVEASGEGIDLVQSSISWTLAANLENLTLTGSSAINGTGNALANVITGNNGSNLLDGGVGADTLVGGLGNDTYVIESVGDLITEVDNEGIDLVQSSITWTLAANLENLTLTGNTAIDGYGNGWANVITGNAAANTLAGGQGDDTYYYSRGGGNDTITDASFGGICAMAMISRSLLVRALLEQEMQVLSCSRMNSTTSTIKVLSRYNLPMERSGPAHRSG
jgi:trimeric autotransporter adhesin